jgi:tetratricopeptide (TPR) repeat protein
VARAVERILVWVAVLVTIAAIVVVAINFAPGLFSGLPWLHLNQQGNQNATTIDLAEEAIARGDTRLALRLALRAMDENRSDAVVANRAGNVALRAGDARAAEKYYLAGESGDRQYPWNFVALGQLYERQGKQELADEQLRAAAVAAPNQPFVHYDLGVVEMQEHLYAAALADFEAELKRSPTYKPAIIGRAEALEQMGRKSEAVVLYRRAGVDTTKQNTTRPKLSVTPVVQPSPTPLPSPPPSPKIALATPSARPKVIHSATPTHIPTAIAGATPSPGPVRPPWATAPPSPEASAVAVAPTASAKPLSEVTADARSYLLDVAQDLDFTRSLPSADPSQTTAALRFNLMDALAHKPVDLDSLLRIGTAALLSGRLTLATAAFNAASDAAPHDWRGPYFAGLTAQANGELQTARTLFATSLARDPRAETYTSIALIDLQNGNQTAAAVNARRAAEMNPSYEPGRFVAGMIDLIQSDLHGAESNLAAAQALGGAPARTAYFLTELHDIVGESGAPGG